jgi:hypothetical protein
MVTRRLIALASVALLAGCEIESTTIPRAEATLVIHSVLNTAERNQFVLVEESLTGRQEVTTDGPYNPGNPIASGNGVPVSGATVTLTDENGFVMTALERRTSSGQPTGIYGIFLDAYNQPGAPAQIVPGRRYTLRVQAAGKVATATTLVPRAVSPIGTPLVPFNRDQQAINLPINDVEMARAYWVYLTAPISPYTLFTLDQEVAISGDSRNLFTEDLVRVFFPGFVQTLLVAAVDSNLYDYYRSGNDPFSGAGLISSIQGGLGLFGSMAIVERRELDVTQDPSGDPIEATFTKRPNANGSTTAGPHTLRLYLESKGADGGLDRLSGSWLTGDAFSGMTRGSVIGDRKGETVDLQILESHSTARVSSLYHLRFSGDTLIGNTRDNIPIRYVRQGK